MLRVASFLPDTVRGQLCNSTDPFVIIIKCNLYLDLIFIETSKFVASGRFAYLGLQAQLNPRFRHSAQAR